jgi:hypothetical protein
MNYELELADARNGEAERKNERQRVRLPCRFCPLCLSQFAISHFRFNNPDFAG